MSSSGRLHRQWWDWYWKTGVPRCRQRYNPGVRARLRLTPGGFLGVNEADNGFDGAVSYFRDKGIAERGVPVGVTRVRFADGSEWTYPLEMRGHFETQPDDKLTRKIAFLRKKQFGDENPLLRLMVPSDLAGKISTCR